MSSQHSILRIMSGEARGVGASLTRGLLSLAEPLYRAGIGWRNRRFDRDPSHIRKLPRPVISVGNLTTGGTGKTPIIRFFAASLRQRGHGVGILSRGYKAKPGTLGDEQRMLLSLLDSPTMRRTTPPIEIEADPDRFTAGERVLDRTPNVDLFLLDDGFQHRRLHRDLDIVLLHASEPFGFGHLLPRGMLREPLSSLRRAGAVVITNVPRDWDSIAREKLISRVRQHNSNVPILFERHEPVGLRGPTCFGVNPPDHSLEELRSRRVFCFSGLGSPGGFEAQVRSLAGSIAGSRQFPDHHDYTPADVAKLQQDAAAAGAEVLVTTEKDWVKLERFSAENAAQPPIWRLDIAAQFLDNGGEELLGLVERNLKQRSK